MVDREGSEHVYNIYEIITAKLLLCQQSITAIAHHNSITMADLVWSLAGLAGQHNVE